MTTLATKPIVDALLTLTSIVGWMNRLQKTASSLFGTSSVVRLNADTACICAFSPFV